MPGSGAHLLSDGDEDEGGTEVRQSVAGHVIIHNCFRVSAATKMSVKLAPRNGVNTHSEGPAAQ